MANVDSRGYTADSKQALFTTGSRLQTIRAVAPVAVATADDDTFILAYNVPIASIVNRIMLPKGSAGITGGTDYDIGVYKSDGQGLGAVIDADCFVDGRDFSSAIACLDINEADSTKTIAELLSLNPDEAYQGGVHIVLTLNTAGSEAQDLDFDIVLSAAG